MSGALLLAVFATVAAGAYLVQSRDVLRIVLGLALLGNAINLVLVASGGHAAAPPAIVAAGAAALAPGAAPALPQALLLTAIVIGFALLCLSMVLLLRVMQAFDSDDVAALLAAEPPDPTDGPLPAFDSDAGPARDGSDDPPHAAAHETAHTTTSPLIPAAGAER